MSIFFSPSQVLNYGVSRMRFKNAKCWNEPVSICLFLTNRCTLLCSWCLRQIDNSFTVNARPDMSIYRAKQILQYFPKATHLSLAGFGEPLLVNNLFEIVAEFKKRPMRVSLITNGTLLIERIDEIIQAGLHRISISMNSLNAIDYQITCGGSENTFDNVIRGIKLLVSRRRLKRPYVHISFVLTRNLFSRTQDIIKFAEDLGIDNLDFHNLIAHGTENDYKEMLTSDDKEVVMLLDEWKGKEYKVRVSWPRLVQKRLDRPARICNPLWDWIGVDMDGNTAGCAKAMPANKEYGNIFEKGKSVWNNEFRKNLRKSFVDRNTFLLACCKTCTEVQP